MNVQISNDYIACCGLRELDGLSQAPSAEAAMYDVAKGMFGPFRPTSKPGEKPVNPYIKPKGVKWEKTTWGQKYFTNKDGMVIYEYMAQDWEDDQRYSDDDYYDNDDYDQKWRYAVFTQAGSRRTYGRKFASLIEREGLGTVVQATTKTVKNPNSGNILKAWIWTVNHKAIKTWAQKYVDANPKKATVW